MIEPVVKLKYITCKDCIDPEHNPGYHMVDWADYPQRVHNTLEPSQFKQPLMLDIGAGGYSQDENFTSVDLHTDADIHSTMWAVPLPDASVDGIFSSNALEHVKQSDVVPTLKEWHRLLVPGGKLQLIIPDLVWAMNWWLDHQDDLGWSMAIIFGHQSHEGEYHKTGFTPEIITRYLYETGLPWTIHKIEYMGGDVSTLQEGEDLYKSHVNQRLINVEAQKGLDE